MTYYNNHKPIMIIGLFFDAPNQLDPRQIQRNFLLTL